MLGRLRTHIRREWFDGDSPRRRTGKSAVLLIASIAVLATLAQLLRVWSVDPLDRLYGEDGWRWLADAQGDPLAALTSTYNGYLQTSSRLIAQIVELLPVRSWAPVMAIAGAGVVTGCAFVVWIASAQLIRDRWARATLAAMTILVGVASQEMFGNVVNTIWPIAFACFWLLLWRPQSERGAMLAGAALLLGVISQSVTLLLAPLWLLRLVIATDRRDRVIVGGFAVGAVIQIAAIAIDGGLRDNGGVAGAAFSTAPFWDWNLVPAYAQRVVGGAIGGYRANAWLWEGLGWAYVGLLGLSMAGLVTWALRTPRTRLLVPVVVALSALMFLITGYLRWGSGGNGFFWPVGDPSDTGARYVVVPTLMLLSAVMIQLDAAVFSARPPVAPRARAGGYLGVGLIAALALVSFKLDPGFDAARWSSALDRAAVTCRMQGAENVEVLTSATPFGHRYVPIPCDRLD